ncbi:hypothetical protein PMAYCL1PPCAC_00719, partial [Pristionchus mayeri]
KCKKIYLKSLLLVELLRSTREFIVIAIDCTERGTVRIGHSNGKLLIGDVFGLLLGSLSLSFLSAPRSAVVAPGTVTSCCVGVAMATIPARGSPDAHQTANDEASTPPSAASLVVVHVVVVVMPVRPLGVVMPFTLPRIPLRTSTVRLVPSLGRRRGRSLGAGHYRSIGCGRSEN